MNHTCSGGRAVRLTARVLMIAAGFAVTSAASAATMVTWTGGGDNSTWSNPLNWSPQIVPMNSGQNEYTVVIPNWVVIEVDAAMPVDFTVSSIQLPANSRVEVLSGQTMTLLTDAGIQGTIVAANSSSVLIAPPTGSSPSSISGAVAFRATNSVIRTGASTVSTNGSALPIAYANGAGGVPALVDMSSVHAFVYGAGGAASGQTCSVQAINGGVVDLSGITWLQAAGGSKMSLQANTGGRIDMRTVMELPGLFAAAATGVGSEIDLSGANTIRNGDNVTFTADGAGSIVRLNNLASLGSGTGRAFAMKNGGTIALNALTDFGAAGSVTFDVANSTLSLPQVTNLGTGSGRTFTISVGGAMALNALSDFGAAGNVSFTITGGSHALPSLTTLGAGSGRTFALSGGAILDLPALTTLGDGQGRAIQVGPGSELRMPGVTRLVNTDITITGTGNLATGALESIDGSSIVVSGNRTYAMPTNITHYATGTRATAAAFRANGTGAILDMSSLTSIEYARNLSVSASDGGLVDLRNVTTLNPSNGAIIGIGLNAGGTINLSSLNAIRRADFTYNGGGTLITQPLMSLDGSTFTSNTGTFVLPATVSTYSALDRGQATLFKADAGGRIVIAPSLQSITFGSTATSGADHRMSAKGGILEFPSLTSMTSANGGILTLEVWSGGTIRMPRLAGLNYAYVDLYGTTSQLQASALTSIDASRLFGNGGSFTTPSAVTAYSTLNLPSSTIFNARTTMSTLNLASIRAISFGSSAASNQSYGIVASEGGVIDLSGVTSASSVNGGMLAIAASGRIDLSSLETLSGARLYSDGILSLPRLRTLDASGQALGTILSVSNGGRIEVPLLQTLTIGNYSTPGSLHSISATRAPLDLRSLESIQMFNGASLRFKSDNGTIRLTSLTVSPSLAIMLDSTGPTSINLLLSGSLRNEAAAPTQFDAARGTIQFDGGAIATLEAAGLDLGVAGRSTHNSGNSGVGSLVLGGGGLAAIVEVADLFNNGFRTISGRESVYIYKSLVLQHGSRLVLTEGVNVYAWIAGAMTDLRSLIPAGQTEIAFGGGFIAIPAPAVTTAIMMMGLFATPRRRA